MPLDRMDITTFEQNLMGLRGGGKRLLEEYARLTRENDELREALTGKPVMVEGRELANATEVLALAITELHGHDVHSLAHALEAIMVAQALATLDGKEKM